MERRRASRRRSAALLLFLARQLGYLSSQLVHAIHDRLQSRIVSEGPGMAHRVGELHRVDEPVVLGAQLVEAGHPPMLALGNSRARTRQLLLDDRAGREDACRMSEQLPALGQLIGVVDARGPHAGPLDRLAAAVGVADQVRGLGDELLDRMVADARTAGCSWTEIGRGLGGGKEGGPPRLTVPVPP